MLPDKYVQNTPNVPVSYNIGHMPPQNTGMQAGFHIETLCTNPKHHDEPRFICLERNCYKFLCVHCLRDHPREHGDPVLVRDVTEQHLSIEDFKAEKAVALDKIRRLIYAKDEKVKAQESLIQRTINEMRIGLNEYAGRFQEEAKTMELDNNPQTREAFLTLINHYDQLERFSFEEGTILGKIEKIQDYIKAKSKLQQTYNLSKEMIINYQIDESKVKAYRDKFGEIIQIVKPTDLLVSSPEKELIPMQKLQILQDKLLASQQESQRLRGERNYWMQAVDQVIHNGQRDKTTCGLIGSGSNLPGSKGLYFCIGKNKGCTAFSIFARESIFLSNPYSIGTNMCLAALHSGVIGKDGGFFYSTQQQGIPLFSGSSDRGIISFELRPPNPAPGFLIS